MPIWTFSPFSIPLGSSNLRYQRDSSLHWQETIAGDRKVGHVGVQIGRELRPPSPSPDIPNAKGTMRPDFCTFTTASTSDGVSSPILGFAPRGLRRIGAHQEQRRGWCGATSGATPMHCQPPSRQLSGGRTALAGFEAGRSGCAEPVSSFGQRKSLYWSVGRQFAASIRAPLGSALKRGRSPVTLGFGPWIRDT